MEYRFWSFWIWWLLPFFFIIWTLEEIFVLLLLHLSHTLLMLLPLVSFLKLIGKWMEMRGRCAMLVKNRIWTMRIWKPQVVISGFMFIYGEFSSEKNEAELKIKKGKKRGKKGVVGFREVRPWLSASVLMLSVGIRFWQVAYLSLYSFD